MPETTRVWPSGAAGLVLDDELLLERLGKLFGDQPADGVRCPARREGHDDPNGLRRPGLRLHRGREEAGAEGGRSEPQRSCNVCKGFHGVLPRTGRHPARRRLVSSRTLRRSLSCPPGAAVTVVRLANSDVRWLLTEPRGGADAYSNFRALHPRHGHSAPSRERGDGARVGPVRSKGVSGQIILFAKCSVRAIIRSKTLCSE
jgi:hypothetical protein